MPRALFLLVLVPALAAAQDGATGAIRGIVLDPAGGRIAQASIVLLNSATSRRHSATSDAEGRFSIELLPPRDYTARVVAQGMSPQGSPTLRLRLWVALEL